MHEPPMAVEQGSVHDICRPILQQLGIVRDYSLHAAHNSGRACVALLEGMARAGAYVEELMDVLAMQAQDSTAVLQVHRYLAHRSFQGYYIGGQPAMPRCLCK